MNYRLLSKLLGLLLFLLSGTMLACLAYAYWDQERKPGLDAVESFAVSILACALTAYILCLLGRGSSKELLRKEAIAVVGLGWVFCAAFGALPYVFCEPSLGVIPAFFEAMSGFTTTGASVITDLDALPRGILLWRSLTQWLGGLGILVLFVALLSSLGVGSKALFHHESSAKTSGGLQARIQDVAVRLWQIYAGLSVLCCLGLMVMGMSLFEAVCHTMSAISTGGFSPRSQSVAAFHNLGVELWLSLFMILGGINFMLYAWLLRRKWDRWTKEEETKCFIWILVGASLVIAVDLVALRNDHSFSQALRESWFQVVSIMTTTGFVTADFDQWPHLSRVVLILLMSIGGCAGSTAGGIKVSRWILFFKIVRVEIIRAFRPNQVIALQLNGNQADDFLKMQTVFFVALAGMTVSLSTALVSLMEPTLDMDSCFSSVVATLFNIGPGLGAVGPMRNFAGLGAATQGFLSLVMLLGRLEFFAVLVLFMPSLWRRY
jgi:trk/ktr system potassium uptake protein